MTREIDTPEEKERMREEAEQSRRGELLADWLGLKRSREYPDRYKTEVGTKTALGIYRLARRAVEQGV